MTDKTLSVSILSPDKSLYNGEAKSVRFPGVMGSFGVLPNHAPLIAQLDVGILDLVNSQGETIQMVVDGGYVEIKSNHLNVLVDGGELVSAINPLKAKDEIEKWEKEPNSSAKSRALKKAKLRILMAQD